MTATTREDPTQVHRELLCRLVSQAVNYYKGKLHTPEGDLVRLLICETGLTPEQLRASPLGYSPSSPSLFGDMAKLAKHLRVHDARLVDSGLGKIHPLWGQVDSLADCITYPIMDGSNVVGVAGVSIRDTHDVSVARICYPNRWTEGETAEMAEQSPWRDIVHLLPKLNPATLDD